MIDRRAAWAAGIAVLLVIGALLGADACGLGGDAEDGEITVFAASSLTEAFRELGTAFEEAHPGAKVTFSFGASSALAVQINEGAPADVFASADVAQMQVAAEGGAVGEYAPFARNLLVVITPVESDDVSEFGDLAKPGLRLVLAGPDVPIGRYAREALAEASRPGGISSDFSEKVLSNLRSDESNVRAVLAKVQLGEADAGVVYQTDVGAALRVNVVDIQSEYNVVAEYFIGAVGDSERLPVARAFVAFVLSAEGQAILQRHGFASP